MQRKVNEHYEKLQEAGGKVIWPDEVVLNDEGLYVFPDGTYLPDGVYDADGYMLIYEKLWTANLLDLVDENAVD